MAINRIGKMETGSSLTFLIQKTGRINIRPRIVLSETLSVGFVGDHITRRLASFVDRRLNESAAGFRKRLKPAAFHPDGAWAVFNSDGKSVGWGAWDRTRDHGIKTRCLTTWLRPSINAAGTYRN